MSYNQSAVLYVCMYSQVQFSYVDLVGLSGYPFVE